MNTIGIRKELGFGFDEAVARLPDALRSEGFGVLTDIDIQATLKQKLGVDFRRYRIFGACNPPLAHQALTTELDIGFMLPCNVVVYEADDGHAVVSAVDPVRTIAAVGVPALEGVAGTVRDKLTRALSRLETA